MKNALIVLVSILFLFISCEEEVIENPPVNTLEANAGNDQQATIDQVIVLDGSKSKDKNNQAFHYLWSIRNKPENSNAILTDETSNSPKFKADKKGDYVIVLEIKNHLFTDTDDVTVVVIDTIIPPVNEPVIINQDIHTERTLTDRIDDPSIPDYLVTEDVRVTALLTIEPSVTIAFEADKAMYIENQGFLRAEGWVDKKVIFTGKEKTPGFWKGLIINSPNEQNLLKYVIIEFGGSNPADGIESAANLALNDESQAKLSIISSTIQHSKAYGLVLESGTIIRVPGADLLLKNNHRPALITASNMKTPFGHVFDNEMNVIDVMGGTVAEPEEIFWQSAIDNSFPAKSIPYHIKGKVLVSSGLRILHGTHLMFDAEGEFLVGRNGYLIAQGIAEDPIRFEGAEPNTTGYWKGIGILSDHELNKLNYVEIYGAGSQTIDGFEKAAAIILSGERRAKINISNSKIERSGGHGLYVENQAVLAGLTFNKFIDNTNAAIALSANEAWKANKMVAMEFYGNGHNGIEIFGSVLLQPDREESVWPDLKFGASYLVSGNLGIQTGLKLMPGTVLQFADGKGINITGNGYLNAQGTDGSKIVFSGLSKTNGFWNGIHFQSNSNNNILRHTVIEYAGKNVGSNALTASVYVGENVVSKLNISHSRIAHGTGYGIAIRTHLGSINNDFESINEFEDLSLGNVFKNTSF